MGDVTLDASPLWERYNPHGFEMFTIGLPRPTGRKADLLKGMAPDLMFAVSVSKKKPLTIQVILQEWRADAQQWVVIAGESTKAFAQRLLQCQTDAQLKKILEPQLVRLRLIADKEEVEWPTR